jgi:hypothetical protein
MPNLAFTVLDESQGEYMVLSDSTPELYVLISIVQEKVESEVLARSFSTPYANALSPGIEAAIESHRSYVHITVSNNHPVEHVIAGMSDDELGDLRPLLEPIQAEFEAELVEGKILLCQHIARLLTQMLPVLAVHWGQSDLLLSPARFAEQNPENFPSLMNVHPFLYSDETGDGRNSAGFRTCGARFLIGREIDFRPCRADFPWMFERTLNFLQMVRINEHEVVPDGHSFGADDNEIIRVRYGPLVEGELPLIVLEVEKSIEHGIMPSTFLSRLRALHRKRTLN